MNALDVRRWVGAGAFRVAGRRRRLLPRRCVLHLCRRQSASLRYVIACGAMAMMLAGAVATAALMKAPSTRQRSSNVPAHRREVRADVLLPIECNTLRRLR